MNSLCALILDVLTNHIFGVLTVILEEQSPAFPRVSFLLSSMSFLKTLLQKKKASPINKRGLKLSKRKITLT